MQFGGRTTFLVVKPIIQDTLGRKHFFLFIFLQFCVPGLLLTLKVASCFLFFCFLITSFFSFLATLIIYYKAFFSKKTDSIF